MKQGDLKSMGTPGALPLKNRRHEVLARERAAGATHAKAWEVAGFNPGSKNASRTFARAHIQARVEYLRAEFTRMAGLSLVALQARLLRIADADAASIVVQDENDRPRLRNLTDLPGDTRAAIAEVKVDADGGVTVRTTSAADRIHAIDSLIKTIGGFVDRVEATGKNGGPVEIAPALLPRHIVNSVAELLDLAERQLGLPHSNSNDAERMTIILGQARKEGGPLPPALYQVLHQKRDERQ